MIASVSSQGGSWTNCITESAGSVERRTPEAPLRWPAFFRRQPFHWPRSLHRIHARLAYRVYEDGHEELVRNVEIAELNAASFKSILAVSDQRSVYTEAEPPRNSPSLNANAVSGTQPLISYVVPSLLFQDVTLQKTSGETLKPTLVDNPLAESR